MKELLEKLQSDAMSAIDDSAVIDDLEKIRLQYLGKKGELTQILKGLGKLPKEELSLIHI